jgi:hypothetical protein
MSDPELLPPASVPPTSEPEDEGQKGPSLVLLYTLIALALAFAIGFALLIVAPFHHRR